MNAFSGDKLLVFAGIAACNLALCRSSTSKMYTKRCEGPATSSFWTADICGYGPTFSALQCDPGNEVGGGAAGLQPDASHTSGPLFDDGAQLWRVHMESNNGSVSTCPSGNGVTIDKSKQEAELEAIRTSGELPEPAAGVLTGRLRAGYFQTSSPGFSVKKDTEVNFDFMQEDCSDSFVSVWLLGYAGTGRAGQHRPYTWVSHFEIDMIENYPNAHPQWPHAWSHNFNYCNGMGNTIPGLCEEKLLPDASPEAFAFPDKKVGKDHFERHVTMWVGEKDCPSNGWGAGDIERYGCVRGRSCLLPEYNMTGRKCPTVFVTNCAVSGKTEQSCEKDEQKAAYHVYDILPGDAINPMYNPGTGDADPVRYRFVIDDWTPAAHSALASRCVLTVNNLRITTGGGVLVV